MIPTYKTGDRVTIDWEAIKGKDLFKYEVNYFPKDCECYGTVLKNFDYIESTSLDDNYVYIVWDICYHDKMHGDNRLGWNLNYKVIKKIESTDQKKLIEQRIKRIYAKSKLPFVQNWSK